MKYFQQKLLFMPGRKAKLCGSGILAGLEDLDKGFENQMTSNPELFFRFVNPVNPSIFFLRVLCG